MQRRSNLVVVVVLHNTLFVLFSMYTYFAQVCDMIKESNDRNNRIVLGRCVFAPVSVVLQLDEYHALRGVKIAPMRLQGSGRRGLPAGVPCRNNIVCVGVASGGVGTDLRWFLCRRLDKGATFPHALDMRWFCYTA